MSLRNRQVAALRCAADEALGWRAKVALLLIADVVDDNGLYWESRANLALRMGCSTKTAYKAVKDLEDVGILHHLDRRTVDVDTSDMERGIDGEVDLGSIRTAWVKRYRFDPTPTPEDHDLLQRWQATEQELSMNRRFNASRSREEARAAELDKLKMLERSETNRYIEQARNRHASEFVNLGGDPNT